MRGRQPDQPGSVEALPPLSRNVKILGAVSLAQDTGSEMLYPLLPAFITRTLGAPVVAVGVAEGLADAIAAIMKLVAGRLAGARRRRRWIAAGYGIATLGKIVVAAAFVWPVVIVGRAIDRMGKGVRGVPRDALIADDTPAGSRGRAFGFHRSLDTLGAVLGPLIGLALLRLVHDRIRPALALAVVPAFVSVLLVALVREADDPTASGATTRERSHTGRHALPPAFWRMLAPLTLFALVNSTDALLLQHAGDVGLHVTEVVLVYVAYNVVYASLGYPAGRLADRVPHRFLFAGGLLVFGVVYMGLGLSSSAAAVWMLIPVYGAYTALTDGVSRAWIADLVPGEHRTWALGVHGGATGVAVLLAGAWSGLAWGGTGRLPLTISGGAALVLAGWIALDRRTDRTPAGSSGVRSAVDEVRGAGDV